MRKSIAASLILVMSTAVAGAQPGADPQGPPPAPMPPMQPQPYAPPPYQPPPYSPGPGYGPPIQLTIEDQELLSSGEISDGEHIAGVALAIFMGFGVGQAIEGTWSDRGWIFTVGEVGTGALMFYGLAQMIVSTCDNPGPTCNGPNKGVGEFVAGLIGFSILRIWEVVDSVTGPIDHNQRLRALRARTGQPVYGRIKPFVAPGANDQGMTAGVTFRF